MDELLTPAQCARADALAVAAGVGMDHLIEQAGLKVAEAVTRRYAARKTFVLCGPGNNGKDGRVAARYLAQWGWPVTLLEDAAITASALAEAELIIDALYGAGLSRDFPVKIADLINHAGVPVVAIDVPSGLDGATGQPRGAAVQADLTITFFRKKPGHLLQPGRNLCGELLLVDIDIPEDVLQQIQPQLWQNSKPSLPAFGQQSHKYQRGHALVFSGSPLTSGASRMAATAALNIGAGLVTLAGTPQALAVQANHVTAIMLAEFDHSTPLQQWVTDRKVTAACIGPAAGVHDTTRANVLALLNSGCATVLDADALTCFANSPAQLFEAIHQNPSRAVVMTPHDGEFSRLFNGLINISDSKTEQACRAALLSGSIIILKGSDTVIAHPDGRAVINSNAPSSLATAGSGDVLAGLVTGLLAQGHDAFAAACAAVWQHGELANAHGPPGLTAETLLAQMSSS